MNYLSVGSSGDTYSFIVVSEDIDKSVFDKDSSYQSLTRVSDSYGEELRGSRRLSYR
jgi:hypothetical protein